MTIVADLIILLILFCCAFYGFRNGLIRTFFHVCGGVISFLIASFLARPIASFCSEKWLSPYLTERLTKTFSERFVNSASESSSDALQSFFSRFSHYGIDKERIEQFWERAGNNTEEFFYSVSESVVSSVSESIGYAIAWIIIFVLAYLLIQFLVKFFDLIAKLPILNVSNKVLGLFLGVCFGLLVSCLFCGVLVVAEPFMIGSESSFFSDFSLDQTVLAKLFCSFFHSPLVV